MPTQDELIQAELDGTIEELEAKMNDDSWAEEVQEQAEQPAEEKEEVKEEPKVEETPKDTPTKKTDSVMKLLKQRNEAIDL